MDAVGRKTFWDTLCSLHTYDYESANKLVAASSFSQELCRFRAVSEQSLLQLQNNEQFFSTADYYDDPFDTFFYINFKALNDSYDSIRIMLDQNNTSPIRDLLTRYGFGNHLDAIIQVLKMTHCDVDRLKISLKDVRNLVQRQIYSICFCEDSLNETMWLKYANQHRGFVQVYDFSDPDTKLCGKEPNCTACSVAKYPPMLFPVYYSSEMYDATAYALAILAREILKENLSLLPPETLSAFVHAVSWANEKISLIKKECHQYDQEWRMLLPTPYTDRPRIKLKPKSVLIGLRTSEHHKQLIISAAHIAGIQEIYQVVINDNNLLGKEKITKG